MNEKELEKCVMPKCNVSESLVETDGGGPICYPHYKEIYFSQIEQEKILYQLNELGIGFKGLK